MSLFKNFSSFRHQYLQFRTYIFKVLNTPAYGQPRLRRTTRTVAKSRLLDSSKTLRRMLDSSSYR